MGSGRIEECCEGVGSGRMHDNDMLHHPHHH